MHAKTVDVCRITLCTSMQTGNLQIAFYVHTQSDPIWTLSRQTENNKCEGPQKNTREHEQMTSIARPSLHCQREEQSNSLGEFEGQPWLSLGIKPEYRKQKDVDSSVINLDICYKI